MGPAAGGDAAFRSRSTRSWLWNVSGDVGRLAAFARTQGVADIAVAVPWDGVTPAVADAVRAFRLAGSAVTALGAQNSWALDSGPALAWARRVTRHTRFDELHLDVEFWNLAEYHVDPVGCVDGFVSLVTALRTSLDLSVVVDLPAGLAIDSPESFRRCASAARAVTLLAYRDRADRIGEFSASARELLAEVDIPYHLGVETQPASAAVPSAITFGDDGRAVLDRELSLATALLTDDTRFRGWAVHHLRSWAELRD